MSFGHACAATCAATCSAARCAACCSAAINSSDKPISILRGSITLGVGMLERNVAVLETIGLGELDSIGLNIVGGEVGNRLRCGGLEYKGVGGLGRIGLGVLEKRLFVAKFGLANGEKEYGLLLANGLEKLGLG